MRKQNLFYAIFLSIGLILITSCFPQPKKTQTIKIKNPELQTISKKYKQEKIDYYKNDADYYESTIEGNWTPSQNTGSLATKEMTFKKIDDYHYTCTLVFMDNSTQIEKLILNSNDEYHTNNRHREYYMLLADEILGSFDDEGLIETYIKSN